MASGVHNSLFLLLIKVENSTLFLLLSILLIMGIMNVFDIHIIVFDITEKVLCTENLDYFLKLVIIVFP